MKKKIIIAEDIDSINTGILTILNKQFDFVIDQCNNCDSAYLKIIKAFQDNEPYDLLISDLSFKNLGFIDQKLKNGEELINAAKQVHHHLKTIVYTIEDKPTLIKRLKNESQVNGIVLKGQNSLPELINAIKDVIIGNNYYTTEVEYLIKNDSTINIDTYDITLLSYLSEGYNQQQISSILKEKDIKPSSVSSIEKRIGELKHSLKANNSIHMVSIAKDMCLI